MYWASVTCQRFLECSGCNTPESDDVVIPSAGEGFAVRREEDTIDLCAPRQCTLECSGCNVPEVDVTGGDHGDTGMC